MNKEEQAQLDILKNYSKNISIILEYTQNSNNSTFLNDLKPIANNPSPKIRGTLIPLTINSN
jgi:hypothetical protein